MSYTDIRGCFFTSFYNKARTHYPPQLAAKAQHTHNQGSPRWGLVASTVSLGRQ